MFATPSARILRGRRYCSHQSAIYHSLTPELRTIVDNLHKMQAKRKPMKLPKRASVLVPFCMIDGQASLLFTMRTETVGSHKGQVSFPGGIVDPTDLDATHTALRETEEEIGIGHNSVHIFGLYHDVPSRNSVTVTPVLGFIEDLDRVDNLNINRHEVEYVFTVPLIELRNGDAWTLDNLGTRGMIPRFKSLNRPDIWGLTGYITHHIIHHLLIPFPVASKPGWDNEIDSNLDPEPPKAEQQLPINSNV